MRAVVRRGKALVMDEMAVPEPGPGQVLVKSLACGICGSDLHALHHLDQMAAMARRVSGESRMDPARDMVFGHEFCAELLDHGPGTARTLKAGTRVVSVPATIGPDGAETVGYSHRYPGGFAEAMVLTEAMLIPVPNGLSAEAAALTEPMAVGLHAANLADLDAAGLAVVIGCGPVGLAVIAALKARGFGPVLAADFSPARRAAAEALGADIIVDPGRESPYARWRDFGIPSSSAERGMALLAGAPAKRAVVFECVGVPGLIQAVLEGLPVQGQAIVVGVCMETDRFEPSLAVMKHLDMRFVLGYTPEEFAASLHHLAEGRIDPAKLITGTVPLAETAQAFSTLGRPEHHIKILVEPGR